MKKSQLEFTTILNHAFGQYEKRIIGYMAEHKAEYATMAEFIKPDLKDSRAVYSRIAFAIVSANAPFDDSVKALDVALRKGAKVRWEDIRWYKQVPAKAKYLQAAYRICQKPREIQKQDAETWHEYRLRLQATFKGLGLTKASFAACLLYPTTADLACIDTWMQKVFLGTSAFKQLGKTDYLMIESRVRTYGALFGVSTFLAQWMIWDHARGRVSSHAIFPGAHKNS